MKFCRIFGRTIIDQRIVEDWVCGFFTELRRTFRKHFFRYFWRAIRRTIFVVYVKNFVGPFRGLKKGFLKNFENLQKDQKHGVLETYLSNSQRFKILAFLIFFNKFSKDQKRGVLNDFFINSQRAKNVFSIRCLFLRCFKRTKGVSS